MDSIKPDWIKRGYISSNQLLKNQNSSENELLKLLTSKEAAQRSIAATLLGERKSEKAVNPLCDALKKEKALYSKIAISEALGNIGIASVNALIGLLGKIGKNQYKSLPDKPFEKWNYPLPRDIAARTIIRIREVAIPHIIQALPILQRGSLSEAIDALGYISFYCQNTSANKLIFNLLELFQKDNLIIWKLITCLQSFPSVETEEILGQFLLNHPQAAIRWEAARSLGQICNKVPEPLILGLNDIDRYVCEMCGNSKSRIIHRSHASANEKNSL